MSQGGKRTRLVFVMVSVVTLIGVCGLVAYLWYAVNNLEGRIGSLESQTLKATTGQTVVASQESDFYTKIGDTISGINAAVGIMSAAASLFGLFGIIFSVINYATNKDLEDSIEKQTSEFANELANYKSQLRQMNSEFRSEMDQINTVQHILYADKHRRTSKYNYAIDEYLKAKNLDKDDYIIEYELGVLYADDYLSYSKESSFVSAKQHLKEAIKKKTDNQLVSDSFMVLGGIYGAKAKRSKQTNCSNAETWFNDSVTCFKESIRYDRFNLEAYTNMALTYMYHGDYDLALGCFKDVIKTEWENFNNNNVLRRYPNVEELLKIVKYDEIDYVVEYMIEKSWKPILDEYMKKYSE